MNKSWLDYKEASAETRKPYKKAVVLNCATLDLNSAIASCDVNITPNRNYYFIWTGGMMGDDFGPDFWELYDYVRTQPGYGDELISQGVAQAILAGYEVVHGGWHIEFEDYYPYIDEDINGKLTSLNIYTGTPPKNDNWQNCYPQQGETQTMSQEDAIAALILS